MEEQCLVPFHRLMSWNPDDSSFIHFLTLLFMGQDIHTVVRGGVIGELTRSGHFPSTVGIQGSSSDREA